MKKNSLFFLTAIFVALLLGACQLESKHKIESVHEVKPIHIIIDLNVKIDRELDNYFGEIDSAEEKLEKNN